MDYSTAVKEKMVRQKLDPFTGTVPLRTPMHQFQPTFYKQESYEPRKFLWFKINKKVGEQIIPVGLCATCGKLEIEHNE